MQNLHFLGTIFQWCFLPCTNLVPGSFSRINFPDLRSPNSFDQINETCSHSWCLLAKGKGLKHSQKGILKKKLVESVRQLSAAIFRVILQSETIWECELLFTTNSLAVQTIHAGKRTRRCSMTHFILSSLINEQMKQDFLCNIPWVTSQPTWVSSGSTHSKNRPNPMSYPSVANSQ